MSFQTPTAWLAVVVHKIVRQLNDDGGVDIGVICQWDGQDVTLLIDSSPETDIDRSILACLDVGDRFSVKEKLKDGPEKSDKSYTAKSSSENKASGSSESNSDGASSESSESGSDSGSSESSSDGASSKSSESGSDSRSSESSSDGASSKSSESGSDSGSSESSSDGNSSGHSDRTNSASPGRHGQEDHVEDIDQRRPSKRQRNSATVDNPQDAGEGQGSSDNNSLILLPRTSDPQEPVPPSSTPSSLPDLTRPTVVSAYLYFDGFGYRRECGVGPALRYPPDAEEVFIFIQKFSNGRRRVIKIHTNTQEREGVNTLIVREQWTENQY